MSRTFSFSPSLCFFVGSFFGLFFSSSIRFTLYGLYVREKSSVMLKPESVSYSARVGGLTVLQPASQWLRTSLMFIVA